MQFRKFRLLTCETRPTTGRKLKQGSIASAPTASIPDNLRSRSRAALKPPATSIPTTTSITHGLLWTFGNLGERRATSCTCKNKTSPWRLPHPRAANLSKALTKAFLLVSASSCEQQHAQAERAGSKETGTWHKPSRSSSRCRCPWCSRHARTGRRASGPFAARPRLPFARPTHTC